MGKSQGQYNLKKGLHPQYVIPKDWNLKNPLEQWTKQKIVVEVVYRGTYTTLCYIGFTISHYKGSRETTPKQPVFFIGSLAFYFQVVRREPGFGGRHINHLSDVELQSCSPDSAAKFFGGPFFRFFFVPPSYKVGWGPKKTGPTFPENSHQALIHTWKWMVVGWNTWPLPFGMTYQCAGELLVWGGYYYKGPTTPLTEVK